MRILIAPNAFKNSLTAPEVAEAIKTGLEQSNLNAVYECFPLGDGGDGTGALISARLEAKQITCFVTDPLGRTIQSWIGFHSATRTAIIELASASGLRMVKLPERNPMISNSYGTGELIRIALDHGARKIILAIGGSATVDGGVGILQALGVRFLDKNLKDLKNIPESLVNLDSIDAANVDQRMLSCELVVLCDVSNPLLGDTGAARTFGPQKGASSSDVESLEASLRQLASVTMKSLGKDISSIKFGGAAGGAGAMLYAVFLAKLLNGFDQFFHLTGLNEALVNSDLVITGEGAIDEQTLMGKAPYGIALKANEQNIPVIALAGQVPHAVSDDLQKNFAAIVSIQHSPTSVDESIRLTRVNLVRTACAIGNLLAIGTYQ